MPVTRNGRVAPTTFPGYALGLNGGQVFYLDSGGVRDGYQDGISTNLFTTLSAALAACRANRGDVIIAMPQHSEGVTATPTFVAGVTILGMGNGDERPTFNWGATTSAWSVTVANVTIDNCILNLASAASTTVTKAVTVSGARSTIRNCQINMGTSSTQLATIGIEYTTGADRPVFDSNDVFSAATSANTNCIKLTNAIDAMRITNNIMSLGMTATTSSLVTMTTAPTNIIIKNNEMTNSITSSSKALVGVSAATGQVSGNYLYIMAATGGATAFGTLGSLGASQNFGCATNGSALLTPAAGS